MADFDPDAYLAPAPSFDPDAYLKPAADPAAVAPAAPTGGEFRRRQHAYRENIHAGLPINPAGAEANVEPQPELQHTPGELGEKWMQAGKGAAKGVPAAIAGGFAGDIEGMGRHAINRLAEREVVSSKPEDQLIPPTSQGGYLGPRGANIMSPAANEDEALGMNVAGGLVGGPMVGGILKAGRAGYGALRGAPRGEIVVHPLRGGAAPEAENAAEVVDLMTGKAPAAPLRELPPSFAEPIATPREGSLGRVMAPEVPHEALPARAGVGADAARGPLADASPQTINALREVMRDAGFTEHTIEQWIEGASNHQVLAEAAPSLFAELQKLAVHGGESRNLIHDTLYTRAREAKPRIRSLFDETFGESENLRQVQAARKREQSRAADPLYREFKSMQVPLTEDLQGLLPRLEAAGAFSEAKHLAAVKGVPWVDDFATMYQQGRGPTAEAWDLAKQGLDAAIEASFKDHLPTKRTRAYTQLKKDLIKAIEDHPDKEIGRVYREAREAFAGPEAITSAEKMGQRFFTMDVDDLIELADGFSTAERAAFARGIRKKLQNDLGNPGRTELPTLRKMTSDNTQEKLRAMIGEEDTARLISGLEHEYGMHFAPDRVLKGSDTGVRTMSNRYGSGPSKAEATAEVIGDIVHGVTHPGKGAAKLASKFATKRETAKLEAEARRLRDEIAPIFLLQGPERDAVLRYLVSPPGPRAKGGRVNRAEGGRAKFDYVVNDNPNGSNRHGARAELPLRSNGLTLTGDAHTYPQLDSRGVPMSVGKDWGASIGLRRSFEDGGAPPMLPGDIIPRGVGALRDYAEEPTPIKSGVAPVDELPTTESTARLTVRPITKRPDEQLGEIVPGYLSDLVSPWKKDEAGKPYAEKPIVGVGKTPEVEKGPVDFGMGFGELASNFFGGPELALGKGLAKIIPAIGKASKAAVLKSAEKLGVSIPAAEKIMAENAGKGLSFPEDKAWNELRMKMQRDQAFAETGKELPGGPLNERRVIRSTNPALPDFVTGKLTFDDWIARQEKLLSSDDIKAAAGWYGKVYDEFLKQTKGDADKAKKYMRGWLVAQQNTDVGSALNNVLLQSEQVARGVPEKKMVAGGMPNPTIAARRIMQDAPIEEGIGQKIADFVDAAEGKNVRSWMANHPGGGEPFVVDIHTGRDTGFMDDRFLNHLKRLGYDERDLNGLKRDITTSAKGTQYENRAQWGRDLTKHLNEIGWQGKTDWTPSEVQAVGWMGMTKLTADKAEDVVSGLNLNTRNLSMELSPGAGSPWAIKYGDRFGALPVEDQYALTHELTQKAIEGASKVAGIDIRDIVHATGGWKFGDSMGQAPSTVAQALSTARGAQIAANYLAHVLQQTEVWANKIKPLTANPKGFAVDFIAYGDNNIRTDAGLRELWQKITDADPMGKSNKPLFQGYQPIVDRDGNPGIRVLIDRGGVKTKESLEQAVSGPIDAVIQSLPYDVKSSLAEAEIYKASNDWTKQKNGQAHSKRLGDLLGRNPAAELSAARKELEEAFRRGLEAAEGRAKAPQDRAVAKEVGSGSVPLAKAAVPDRATGGSVFETAARLARKYRAEGGDVSDTAPFELSGGDAPKTWDGPAEAQAARESAARGVARGIRHSIPVGLLPPEGSEPAPPEAFPRPLWMVEPDLQGYQSGDYGLPQGAALNDANEPFYPDTGEKISVVKRPGMLPMIMKPDGGTQFVTPKLLDLFSNVMSPVAAGRAPVKAGEMVLGSGAVRTRRVPSPDDVYWHGTASGDLRGGSSGLHLGTREQATAALEARIGIPADGKGWTGSRSYGDTLLAGSDSLRSGKFGKYRESGFNIDRDGAFPKEDFYAKDYFAKHPDQWPKYPDGTPMPLDVKPTVDPYRITGRMTNDHNTAHPDFKANGYMKAQLKKGNPRSGYFYNNVGEGEGISAVVPNGSWVERVDQTDRNLGKTLYSDTRNQVAGEVGHQAEKALQPAPAFFSTLDRAVDNAKMQKGTPEQWAGYLRNQPGISPAEMEWRLSEALASSPKKQLAKEEVKQLLGQNTVDVTEIARGERVVNSEIEKLERELADLEREHNRVNEKVQQLPATSFDRHQAIKESHDITVQMNERHDRIRDLMSSDSATRFTQHMEPGENQREFVMTLPVNKAPLTQPQDLKALGYRTETINENPYTGQREIHVFNEQGNRVSRRSGTRLTPDEVLEELAASRAEEASQFDHNRANYRVPSLHGYGDPKSDVNRFAHVFTNDLNIGGKKYLNVAELQSDWAQAGLQKGFAFDRAEPLSAKSLPSKLLYYTVPWGSRVPQRSQWEIRDAKDRLVGYVNHQPGVVENEQQALARAREKLPTKIQGVPDFPLKNNWHEVAMKRMIRRAIDEGYDGVSWVNGQTVADRYDLSRVVSQIAVDPMRDFKTGEIFGTNLKIKTADGVKDITVRPNGVLENSADLPDVAGKPLSELVGKGMADKIMGMDKKTTIKGDGLKIGGEFHKKFYNDVLPRDMNKMLKKLGAKVGTAQTPKSAKGWQVVDATDDGGGTVYSEHRTKREAERAARQEHGNSGIDIRPTPQSGGNVHTITFTPEFKQKVLDNGFNLFSDTRNQVAGQVGHQVEKNTQPSGLRAWHASPHYFEKFSMKNVGRGQGAQSYGHGLYFAENPAISGVGGAYHKEFASSYPTGSPASFAQGYLHQAGYDRAKALAFAEKEIADNQRWLNDTGNYFDHRGQPDPSYASFAKLTEKRIKAAELLSSGRAGPHVYEVNINAKPEQMLDWDNPLMSQPGMTEQLKPLLKKARRQLKEIDPDIDSPELHTGKNIYGALSDFFENNRRATDLLRGEGVPGIKYLDQGSRAYGVAEKMIEKYGSRAAALDVAKERLAKAGLGDLAFWDNMVKSLQPETRNFVVFDDNLIDILKKYSIAIPGVGAVGAGQSGVGNDD